jgi:hypothetical protein
MGAYGLLMTTLYASLAGGCSDDDMTRYDGMGALPLMQCAMQASSGCGCRLYAMFENMVCRRESADISEAGLVHQSPFQGLLTLHTLHRYAPTISATVAARAAPLRFALA